MNDAPRYAVTMLSMGTGEIPGPEARWMRDFEQWTTLDFQVGLIQGGGEVVLVNTGPPRDLTAMNAGWEAFLGARAAFRRAPGQYLLDQLAERGIGPEAVTRIVLTPLQLYTVGSLLAFPNAEISLARRGWVHFHTTHRHPHDDRDTSIPPDVLRHLVTEAWPRVRLLEDEDEILPGIRTWWCGGHHRASLVVEVDTPAGVAALSDAYFTRSNVVDDHPIGISENIYESLACYERVRRTADLIVPLYDPGNASRYPDGVVSR